MGFGYRHFGFLSLGDGDGLRFTWLQIVCPGHLAFEVHDRGPDRDGDARWGMTIGLGLLTAYLSMPFLNRLDRKLTQRGRDGFGDSWGVSYRFGREWDSTLRLDWGDWSKSIHMPWALDWFRTSYLLADGTWAHEWRKARLSLSEQGWELIKRIEPLQWREVYPYRYVLKDGRVQDRNATVTVEEREWRRRGWRWLTLGRKVKRTIDVRFDDEVGERSGSWKGGTIGCGYDMRPSETPLQCLRRMERDRVFR